jgi:hypothetical protein
VDDDNVIDFAEARARLRPDADPIVPQHYRHARAADGPERLQGIEVNAAIPRNATPFVLLECLTAERVVSYAVLNGDVARKLARRLLEAVDELEAATGGDHG